MTAQVFQFKKRTGTLCSVDDSLLGFFFFTMYVLYVYINHNGGQVR